MQQKYILKDFKLEENRKHKSKFISKKDNTLNSLREVEYFLGNWKRIFKGIKLYKILK